MSDKIARPAAWTWVEYTKTGEQQVVMEDERGAAFVRRVLADIGQQTGDVLREYFFACPPEIPLDDYKTTLRFLAFLATLNDDEKWDTSGEQQIDAARYVID